MDRVDSDTYAVPRFLLDRLSWFSMVLTCASKAPLINRNTFPGERYSLDFLRCKNIRCEAPEIMHSFSPLFAFQWPLKQGLEFSSFLSLSLLMTLMMSAGDIGCSGVLATLSDCQNITGGDIQSPLKLFSLNTASGLLSWKKYKTKIVVKLSKWPQESPKCFVSFYLVFEVFLTDLGGKLV